MKPTKYERVIATGFYTGLSPFAPGTVGSLLAIIIYWIPGFEQPYVIIPLSVITFFYGVKISTKMEHILGKDPSEVTIDEFIGTWISMLFLPKSITISIITFIIWRILDILKPPPAGLMERLPQGWGIMLDDVVSGFYAAIIVHLLLHFNLIPI